MTWLIAAVDLQTSGVTTAMNRSGDDIGSVTSLEDWFSARCDEDWEHSFGISIETLDNPGWSVKIDLIDTPWADLSIPFSHSERSDTDWIQIEIVEGKFIGSGGVRNLTEILRKFHAIVGKPAINADIP